MLSCFDLLSKLDNPEMEYDHWVELGQDLPEELRHLSGVNTEDKAQVDDFLVPLFSRNKGVVDFYQNLPIASSLPSGCTRVSIQTADLGLGSGRKQGGLDNRL